MTAQGDPYAWRPPKYKGEAPYEWTDAMEELSGFGGDYEDACRKMLHAGLMWLDANPKAEPLFRGFKHVYGILADDNLDAIDLSNAVVAVVDDCTGAMHQCAIQAALYVSKNGWAKFVEGREKIKRESKAREAKEGS